ncbi:hypothetical protein [Gemmatimonas sp.]|uniref:hypothetical protein n=1 Tax=Gemmatimonas sp. TaxID=1962908 RepID=UPI00286E7D77|nr:hypothetical protein [Gemmatimonas sp.]
MLLRTSTRPRPFVRALLAATFTCSVISAVAATPAQAQARKYFEQMYLPGSHSFAFNTMYPRASYLFNAFDYGHAILYERLWRSPSTAARDLDGREYDLLTQKLLEKPPRVPLDEAAVGPSWALLAPETLAMFSWAHMLHRQLYDVLVHDAGKPAERDAHVAELVRYYKTRPLLAFSSHPKDMNLMEGQSYSLAFRKQNPKFNGLVWSYHWIQMTLYEAMLASEAKADMDVNVNAVVDRFYEMTRGGIDKLPTVMPMSPAIAPDFSTRYPEAAIIFDNLHSLHDVVSDILANPNVPRDKKRATILDASKQYRDSTTSVTTVDEWVSMGHAMGLTQQGGPAPVPRRPAPKAAAPHKHPGS